MKRFFFIATMAIMAIGCQKTEVQNEVFKPIGFNTEVGKQTRAIVTGDYLDPQSPQPFAVYAYGHQPKSDQSITKTTVMDNVEIGYTAATTEGQNVIPAKWAATGKTKYYWPNDPYTTIDFYAYSPAHVTTSAYTLKNHQKLNGTITCHDGNGLTLTDYVHNNMYVDFMVATPVKGATYSNTDPNTITTSPEKDGEVPTVFGHKFTQVNFTVKIADGQSYPNVDFAINSITLNDINCKGTYTYANEVANPATAPWSFEQDPQKASYRIYPATTLTNLGTEQAPINNMNDAPALVNVDNAEATEVAVVLETDATPKTAATGNTPAEYYKRNPGTLFTTTPVTMIPQNLSAQTCTIVYTVSGTGVATETITKTFNLSDGTLTAWSPNMRVRYTLTMSLNEITFFPSVTPWADETSVDYDFNDDSATNTQSNNNPAQGV